jgi:anti-anti-sigma factor
VSANLITDRHVLLTGRVDASTASEVRATLHRAVTEGAGPLVLDLADVTQLDAVGLGVLMGVYERAHSLGRDVELRRVPPRIAFTLRRSGVSRVLRPTAA